MSGYMIVMGPCFSCGRVFGFNAELVPSFQGEAICGTCMERVNEKRKEGGLPEWPVHADAYHPQEVS